jgi:hypothetical protein
MIDIPQEDAGDEDTVFVSLADLFSLLSLTIIYVVLTFGQTTPANSEPVVASSFSGTGPGERVDPQDIYVTLEGRPEGIAFRVIQRDTPVEKTIPVTQEVPQIPKDWLLQTIPQSHSGMIYVYLSPEENDRTVRALFTDVEEFLCHSFQRVNVTFPRAP